MRTRIGQPVPSCLTRFREFCELDPVPNVPTRFTSVGVIFRVLSWVSGCVTDMAEIGAVVTREGDKFVIFTLDGSGRAAAAGFDKAFVVNCNDVCCNFRSSVVVLCF